MSASGPSPSWSSTANGFSPTNQAAAFSTTSYTSASGFPAHSHASLVQSRVGDTSVLAMVGGLLWRIATFSSCKSLARSQQLAAKSCLSGAAFDQALYAPGNGSHLDRGEQIPLLAAGGSRRERCSGRRRRYPAGRRGCNRHQGLRLC